MDKANNERLTRWEALKEIMDNHNCRTAIAYAWPLYFHLVFHSDKSNRFVTNYPSLKEELKAPASTIKKWKERLIQERVLTSIQGNHEWTITLLPPYDTPITCLRSDHTEIVLKSDDQTKKLMKKMFSSESVSLLPFIAELAHKVEIIEQSQRKAG